MAENWAQWEGQVVDGEFRLDRYLGGAEQSGVFLTEFGGQKAAIKLVAGEPRHEWGAGLAHPNLIRIFRTGRWELNQARFHYVVMEYADEVLLRALVERALDPEEARETLGPVLSALAYVHSERLTHGHIKPANILSVGEQLKISSDGLQRSGDTGLVPWMRGPYDAPEVAEGRISPAADVWSLGITLVEALTQRMPALSGASRPVPGESVPEPFREIAGNCLRTDPQQRWTVSQIAARLSPGAPAQPRVIAMPRPQTAPEPERVSAKRYAVPAIAALAAVLVVIAGARFLKRQPEAPPASPSANVASREAKPPAPPPAPAEEKPSPTGRVRGKIEKEVTPQVTSQARETIQGRVRVRVAVRVDPSGNVSEAKLDTPRVSRYFGNASLQAARRFKFAPAKVEGRAVATSWVLEFDYARSGTQVHSRQLAKAE
jgi:TonB family protein